MQYIQSNQYPDSFYQYFSNLSAPEQAGFFLWPSIRSNTLTLNEKNLFLEIKPSGIVLFKRNFLDVHQAKELISEIRDCCRKNFIVSVDEEGGRVSRFPLDSKTKPVLEFTKQHDKNGLKLQVLTQVEFAKKIGVNCILAPVVDILTEPTNTVIGDRSFGYTPAEVCEYANVVFETLEAQHIFSCAKHFPGHGNTKTDSHFDFATSDATEEILSEREWKPFVYFIQKNIPLIMAAHVMMPNLETDPAVKPRDDMHKPRDDMRKPRDDIPATLNPYILTHILRNKLGFKGLILSDDLRMGAIKKYYQQKGISEKDYVAQAAIDAILAGCDILLSCSSIEDEKIIIDSISQKMHKEKDFFDLCCEKAYRQTLLFSSHFLDEDNKIGEK